MRIRIKLFALLDKYIPEGMGIGPPGNEAALDVADGTTITSVFDQLNLPAAHCHLVLVNGVFIPPSERHGHTLAGDDHLAVWPPVAGGGENENGGRGDDKKNVAGFRVCGP